MSATEPTDSDWSGVGVCYSATGQSFSGGLIGFQSAAGSVGVDNVTIKSWNTSTSAYDITEFKEDFALSSGNSVNTFANDNNGNLSFDGTQAYYYDAWNRLIKVRHAYRDSMGAIQVGQVFDQMSYDAKGRRVTKAVSNTGQWDCTYHYYYDGQRQIEMRNGSEFPMKQYTWGQLYVDELVRTELNSNPEDGNDTCDLKYWACQDANFNVRGIVDVSGVLKERYEYTPYGQRTVFFAPGSNDAGCNAPTIASQRYYNPDYSVTEPWGLCDIGHQGLLHDEEDSFVYNRARYLAPSLGRFMHRDYLGEFQDGLNQYQYARINPVKFRDATGAFTINLDFNAFIPKSHGVSENDLSDFNWFRAPLPPWSYLQYLNNVNLQTWTWFETDNRENPGEPGTGRLKTHVDFDSKKIGKLTTVIFTKGADPTYKLEAGDIQGYPAITLAQADIEKKTPNVNAKYTVSNSKGRCKCSYIHIEADASDPFIWYAPSIWTDVTWQVCSWDGGNTAQISVTGETTKYLAFEGIANKKTVYATNPLIPLLGSET